MEQAQNLLRLSQDQWSRTSNNWDNPTYIATLSALYRDLADNPAFIDFVGFISDLHARTQKALLYGSRAADGTDATPQLRAVFGILSNILARIPSVHARHAQFSGTIDKTEQS